MTSGPGGSEPVDVTLTIEDRTVRLTGPDIEVTASHDSTHVDLDEARKGLRRMRSSLLVSSELPLGLSATPTQVGRLMADAFLPDPVAAGFAHLVGVAQSGTGWVRLGIEIAPKWRELPWEALPMPDRDRPIALHPLVTVYRRYPTAKRVTPTAGPLRILVAISSPGSDDGGLLNYERELRNVLAATGAVRERRAEVQILRFATTREIKAALTAAPPHVLHLSAHGMPGSIELEYENGDSHPVSASQFVEEAVPSAGIPPLIVLSACHSNVAPSEGAPTFASELIEHGAAVVVGTETAITDIYATRLFGRLYATLSGDTPDVISALGRARRVVEGELTDSPNPREQGIARLEEWAAVSVLSACGTATLLDSDLPERPATPALDDGLAGLPIRLTGEFVGRRRQQRRWAAELVGNNSAGLLLHGIGGIGKTALASELVRGFAEQNPSPLTIVIGKATAGADALRERFDEAWTAVQSAKPQHDALGSGPVLLVLDGLDDQLTDDDPPDRTGWRRVRDPGLGELLAELIADPRRCRLLITCRHPFVLPGGAERALTVLPVGPLSAAETMKLAWALPALDRLGTPDLERIYDVLGGHPRCLHRLDDLLAQGRQLEAALGEVVAVIAREEQVDRLFAELEHHPQAADLLLRASVYSEPVDLIGLQFLYAEFEPGVSYMPQLAWETAKRILAEAGMPDFDGFFIELPDELRQSLAPHQRVIDHPHRPLVHYRDLDAPINACVAVGLLTIDGTGQKMRFSVHRWAAVHLHRRWANDGPADRVAAAHRCAAEYLQWRVQYYVEVPDDDAVFDPYDLLNTEQEDLHDLLEARHHLLAAGEAAETAILTNDILDRLHDLGSWDTEEALTRLSMNEVPSSSEQRAAHLGRLGDIARGQGRFPEATDLYQQSLNLTRSLAVQNPDTTHHLALSIALKRVGDLYCAMGAMVAATIPYQEALGVDFRELDRHPHNHDVRLQLVVSLRNMGDLLVDDMKPDDAAIDYTDALGLLADLILADPENSRYRREFARLHGRLGALAFDAEHPAEAERLYRQALAIAKELHDQDRTTADQLELASFSTRLGDIARAAGDNGAARKHYKLSLRVHESLVTGDRANTEFQHGLSGAYARLGDLALDNGERQKATYHYREGMLILRRLAEQDESSITAKRDLGVLAMKLGELALKASATEAAIASFGEAVRARTSILRWKPTYINANRELCTAQERMAAALTEADRRDEALEHLDLALQRRDQLRILEDRDGIIYAAGAPPDRVALVEEVAATHLARIRVSGVAEPNRSRALALLEPLQRQGRLTEKGAEILTSLCPPSVARPNVLTTDSPIPTQGWHVASVVRVALTWLRKLIGFQSGR